MITHSYIDEGFPVPTSYSKFCLTRNVNPFIRGVFDGGNVCQLPVIKEEEGSIFEEESERSTVNTENEEESLRLSSININCMMNVNIKQSRCIWDTNFGKRLINSNCSYGVLNGPDGVIGKSQPSVRTKFSRKSHKENIKKDKMLTNQKRNSWNKPKTMREKSPEIIKQENTHEKSLDDIMNSTETFTKTSNTVSISDTSTSALSSKATPLTECVKRIFENNSLPFNCEFCDDTFSDIEELCNHQNQHEFDKETCLLCDRVFYNSSNFTQHLLTHEGVDQFSCKKCMTYFPNLIKYKRHVQEFHYVPPPVVSYIRPPRLDNVEKWYAKFECKRCKMELDSAKAYETHKRTHLKKDLARAYFLSYNNI